MAVECRSRGVPLPHKFANILVFFLGLIFQVPCSSRRRFLPQRPEPLAPGQSVAEFHTNLVHINRHL